MMSLSLPMLTHLSEGKHLPRAEPQKSLCFVPKPKRPQYHFLKPLTPELILLSEEKNYNKTTRVTKFLKITMTTWFSQGEFQFFSGFINSFSFTIRANVMSCIADRSLDPFYFSLKKSSCFSTETWVDNFKIELIDIQFFVKLSRSMREIYLFELCNTDSVIFCFHNPFPYFPLRFNLFARKYQPKIM